MSSSINTNSNGVGSATSLQLQQQSIQQQQQHQLMLLLNSQMPTFNSGTSTSSNSSTSGSSTSTNTSRTNPMSINNNNNNKSKFQQPNSLPIRNSLSQQLIHQSSTSTTVPIPSTQTNNNNNHITVSSSSSINSPIVLNNIVYKGWILTLQETLSNTTTTTTSSTGSTGHKWIPKFAIISKLDKTLLLYDYEPNSFISSCLASSSYSSTGSTNSSGSSNNNLTQINGQNGLTTVTQPSSTSSSSNNDIVYRLDNSIKRETFLNYWRNKSGKFDFNLVKSNDDGYFKQNNFHNNTNTNNINHPINSTYTNTGGSIGASLSQQLHFHHHLSNKDIESLDKDSLNSFTTATLNSNNLNYNDTESINTNASSIGTATSNATTTGTSTGTGTGTAITQSQTSNIAQGNGTFRFAGLFFKKDKAEKAKHSSLKRAKSGIQLERKKPIAINPNNTIVASNSKINNLASALAANFNNINSSNSGSSSTHSHSNNNNNNNLAATTNTTTITAALINNDYDNRNSLPSPMRPSRSHESLSPLKLASTSTATATATTTAAAAVGAVGVNRNDSNETIKFNKSSSVKSRIKLSANQQQQQTPSIKSKCSSLQQSSNSSQLLAAQSQIESVIKLELKNSTDSVQTPMTTTSNLTTLPVTNTPLVIHSIHTSLFNEENCFEVKCLNSTISIFNQTTPSPNTEDINPKYFENEDEYEYYNSTKSCANEIMNDNDDNDDYDEYDDSEYIENNYDCDLEQTNLQVVGIQRANNLRKSNLSRRSKPPAHQQQANHIRKELQPQQQQQQQQQQQHFKCYNSSKNYTSRYFMCRTSDEKEKWIQCLRNVSNPNLIGERHDENSLQLWLLEAKGQTISSKSNKKYFCEILLNNALHARTCSKEKKDILFWGENFDFNSIQCDYIRVELYQETIETTKKKSKKESSNSTSKEKDSNNNISSSTKSIHVHTPNQVLLGYVNIPVNTVESSQPIEKWYRLEAPSTLDNHNNIVFNHLIQPINGVLIDPMSSSSSTTNSASQQITLNQTNNPNTTVTSSSSNPLTIASLTTTQNFSKDSISIRIKAKYQSVDILPLQCYQNLIEYIREKYLDLMLTLEPHLNVRVKDDLANSLVRIAHKLQIQTKFLSDLVLAEVLHLEDSSLTFRGNSLATKSMESYMKLVGENYLKQTMSDCVRSIIDTYHDLEIDPSKVSNQSSLQANREELVQILHLVCGRVFNSFVNFPNEMKYVFARLRSECKKHGKTDEMCDMLISASIFLRFICPAILSPNLFNLTQEYPQEKAARKLTLAAKTLQTIANFSKFGGKEFYMSFDKMNQFVDEQTVLMREFLRNISTINPDDPDFQQFELNESNRLYDFSKTILPIVSLTPQTPNIPNESDSNTTHNNGTTNTTKSFHSTTNNKLNEPNFELELIDLGKQLSILHSLLTTIIATLDEQTRAKFNNELIEILDEITNLKKAPIRLSAVAAGVASGTESNTNGNQQQTTTGAGGTNNSKLYSYENRLHHIIMKNQHTQGHHNQTANSPLTPPTPPSAAPIMMPMSISNPVVPNTIETPIYSNPSTNQMPNSSSSSSSSRYSSQITLNIDPNINYNNPKLAIANLNQQKLETEISLLKQKLKETEITLKREQAEKQMIEYKLKQQQQDNDQQMRNIINRLIKVEEELRKEQNEMHKLLKAKQDLIEIQKKRIEYLTNRANLSKSNNHQQSSSSSSSSSSAHYHNQNQQMLQSAPKQQQQQLQLHQQQQQQQQQQIITNNLTNNYQTTNQQNQKVRQSSNKIQLKSEQLLNSLSNQQLKSSSNDLTNSTLTNTNYINTNNNNINSTTPTSLLTQTINQAASIKLTDKIAASPSSSASSMTQFCNYLASNSLNSNETTNYKLYKMNSNHNDGKFAAAASSSSSPASGSTIDPLVTSAGGGISGGASTSTSTSTSSSSSALSMSSSLNHLNSNHHHQHHNHHHHNHNHQHQQQQPSSNFLRTSEL